jgi:hypothetical protein
MKSFRGLEACNLVTAIFTSFACKVISRSYFWTHVAFTSTHITLKEQCMPHVVICLSSQLGCPILVAVGSSGFLMMSQPSSFSNKIT